MGDHTHDARKALERQRRTVEAGASVLTRLHQLVAYLEGPPGEPGDEPVEVDVPNLVFIVLTMSAEIARLEDEARILENELLRLERLLTDATWRICELEGRR